MPEEDQKSDNQTKQGGFLGRLLSMPNDSIVKTVFMTVMVCLVCAIVVATAAVALKEKQEINKLVDVRKNILQVAGLDDDSMSMEDRFALIDTKIVDLETGEYVDELDVDTFDQRVAAKDPEQSVELSDDEDIAGIGRRANYAKVYLVKDDSDQVNKVILPVHGYGLWSTLYGFISLETDLSTIYRVIFYEHGETPGLGGEVDNPNWRAVWNGKQLFDENGEYNFHLVKGSVNPANAQADYQVDGLAGATLTTNGVSNLFKYWLTDQGFGPYIDKLRTSQG